jgi:hypothetical protein
LPDIYFKNQREDWIFKKKGGIILKNGTIFFSRQIVECLKICPGNLFFTFFKLFSVNFNISTNKMRSLIFDELRTKEIESIKDYLLLNSLTGPIDGLYWLNIPEELLTDNQKKILNSDGPFKIAIELGKNWIKFELLLRSSSLYNTEGKIVTNSQLFYIYNFADTIAQTLNLTTCM